MAKQNLIFVKGLTSGAGIEAVDACLTSSFFGHIPKSISSNIQAVARLH